GPWHEDIGDGVLAHLREGVFQQLFHLHVGLGQVCALGAVPQHGEHMFQCVFVRMRPHPSSGQFEFVVGVRLGAQLGTQVHTHRVVSRSHSSSATTVPEATERNCAPSG